MGGVEDEFNKNSGDGMPSMPDVRGTGICRIYPADDGGELEIQGETEDVGQIPRLCEELALSTIFTFNP